MKKISRITEIEPEESMCITVDSDYKLFSAGGNNTSEFASRYGSRLPSATVDSARAVASTMTATLEKKDANGHTDALAGTRFVSHNSVLQRSIIFSCVLRPESWAFVGIDLKKVELTPYVVYQNVLGVATTLENALEVLRFAQQTMMKRYDMMEKLGLKNFLDLPEKGQALMVMIDEYGEAASPSGSKTDEGKEADAMKGEIQMLTGSIARLGRAAGVHLVVATQRPDAKMLPGETKALDISTPILTDSGVKEMKDVHVGDRVASSDGSWTAVIGETDTLKDRDCIELTFDTGEKIVCDSTHRWPVVVRGVEGIESEKVTFTASEILALCSREDFVPDAGVLSIPLVCPVEREEVDLTVSPDVLGRWIAGKLSPQAHRDNASKLHHSPSELVSEIITGSISQRRDFIHALMDTEFVSTDKDTVDMVVAVCASLGVKTSRRVSQAGAHTVSMVPMEDSVYITGAKKVKSRGVKCIEVDNDVHEYSCGVSMVATHNSNLGCRINCGNTNSTASSMILDDAEGTKVKAFPKGRFYIKIYSTGNHGQAFWAKEDWMDKYLESQGLNPDGTPLDGSAPVEGGNTDGFDLSLHDTEDSGGQYERPEDDWDDDLDELISDNEEN